VQYTSVATGVYTEIMKMAILAKTEPDVYGTPPGYPPWKLVEMGRIMPLEECAPSKKEFEKWKKRYPPEFFVDDANVFDGKLYLLACKAAPYSGFVLFYNKTLFREAGIVDKNGKPTPPRTFSEMRKYAKIITEKGKGRYYGIIGYGSPSSAGWSTSVQELLTAGGAYPATQVDLRVGRFDFHHPVWKEAIQVWKDMYEDGSVFPGSFHMTDEQAKMNFALNRAGMQFGGWWNPRGYKSFNPDCDFDVVLAPTPDDGVRRGYVAKRVGGGNYVISRNCKHPKAVWELIKFLTSTEYQENYVKNGNGLSVFPELNKPEYFALPTMKKLAKWAVSATRIRPYNPAPKEYTKLLWLMDPVRPEGMTFIEGIVTGVMELEKGLYEQEAKLNTSLDNALKKAKAIGLKISRKDFTFPDLDITKDYVPSQTRKSE